MNDNSEQPLASELFGGSTQLATQIVTNLLAQPEAHACFGDRLEGDPVSALSRISKSEVTRFLFLNDLASNQLFPSIEWGESRTYWEQAQAESLATVGSNGHAAPPELALRLFVQQRALQELCAPNPPPTEKEVRRIEDFRERYKSAVNP
jgi:hypothetical protein